MDQIPCTLDRCAISALITVLSTVFRKKEWTSAHSLRVLFPGIAEGSPSAPTNMRLHERPAGCFKLAGLQVISRSAEPQMQRTSMFLLKQNSRHVLKADNHGDLRRKPEHRPWPHAQPLQVRAGCSMKIGASDGRQLQCASFVAKGIPTASNTTRYSAPVIAPNLQKSFVGM